jgi:adenosylcobyric acid synthase
LDQWLGAQYRGGATIIGICGGFQMLGEAIMDPYAMESNCLETGGLGLLPARTTMRREKTTRVVRAGTPGGHEFPAYEIHLGETIMPRDSVPFAILEDGTRDGIRRDRIAGTYLHGAFEDPVVLAELGITPALRSEQPYDRLADWFEQYAQGFEELFL